MVLKVIRTGVGWVWFARLALFVTGGFGAWRGVGDGIKGRKREWGEKETGGEVGEGKGGGGRGRGGEGAGRSCSCTCSKSQDWN